MKSSFYPQSKDSSSIFRVNTLKESKRNSYFRTKTENYNKSDLSKIYDELIEKLKTSPPHIKSSFTKQTYVNKYKLEENEKKKIKKNLTIPEEVGFWNRMRDVLLDGCLEAEGPESGYSMIRSSRDGVTVAVSYTDPVLKLSRFRAAYHVNATPGGELYVRFAGGGRGRKRSRPYTFRVLDCTGSPVSSGELPPSTELARFEVPRCGMLALS